MNLQATHCCGMNIYEGIVYDKSPNDSLRHIATEAGRMGFAIDRSTGRPKFYTTSLILFADVRGFGVTSHMEAVIKTILENGMGTIWSSEWIKNAVNDVRTVTWCVDKEAFTEWAIENVEEIGRKYRHSKEFI